MPDVEQVYIYDASLPEPLCDKSELFNVGETKYPDIRENYIQQRDRFWTEDEIDFSGDYSSWLTFDEGTRFFVEQTLAYFANSDNIVLKNVATNFMKEITATPVIQALGFQVMMEGIHSDTYTNCITAVEPDVEKADRLLNSIDTNPIVKPKLDWCLKWLSSDKPLGQRLIAWGLVEGVFFSSSFASLIWIRKFKNGAIPGICFANEKIIPDESLHVELGSLIYKHIVNRVPESVVIAMTKEAVALEQEFTTSALPVSLIGMDSEKMCRYIELQTDVVLGLFGYSPIYKGGNPFDWMIDIGLQGKTSFFEKRVSDYMQVKKETSLLTTTLTNLGDDIPE